MGRVWRGNKDSGDTGPSGPFSQDPANAPWPGCLALGTAEPVRQGGRLSPSSVSRVRVLGEVPGSPHPPLPPPSSMKCLGVDGSGGGWAALVSLWEPGWLPTGGASMVVGLGHGQPPRSAWPGSQWAADVRPGCGQPSEAGAQLALGPRSRVADWMCSGVCGSPMFCRRASRLARGLGRGVRRGHGEVPPCPHLIQRSPWIRFLIVIQCQLFGGSGKRFLLLEKCLRASETRTTALCLPSTVCRA